MLKYFMFSVIFYFTLENSSGYKIKNDSDAKLHNNVNLKAKCFCAARCRFLKYLL